MANSGDRAAPTTREEAESGTVEITFNGRRRRVPKDRQLAAGLLETGTQVFTRSLKYRRPRGPFCGRGQCTGCLIRLNGVPMVRSCEVFPRPGDRVETEAGWPSTDHDLFRGMDWLYSQGMDTTRGFTRPQFLRPAYISLVRKFGGLGALPTGGPGRVSSPERVSVEVLVVGGGSSGSWSRQRITQLRPKSRVLAVDQKQEGHSVVFLAPLNGKGFQSVVQRPGKGALLVDAQRVIVATGTYGAGLPFRGSELPGTHTGDGLMNLYPQPSRSGIRRLAVFGGGPSTLALLDAWKDRIGVLAAPWDLAPATRTRAQELGIPVREQTLLTAARGSRKVQSIELTHRGSHEVESHAADALAIAHRMLPQSGLLFQVGAEMRWHNAGSAYYPVLTENCETSVPGVFAVGGVAGFTEEADVQESAERAVAAVLDERPLTPPRGRSAVGAADGLLSRRRAREGPSPMLDYHREFLSVKGNKKIVLCPCEDVTLGEVERVVHDGWEPSLEVAKRLTGTGMGLCQGRYCMPDTVLLLAVLSGRDPSEVGFFTQRPPVWPIRIGDLGGSG